MKALALVDSPDHVCCRYRVRAFGPALSKAGWALSFEALERNSLKRYRQLGRVDQYDAVLLQRRLLPLWQLKLLRHRARRLIFDFDDAVLYRDSYDSRGPHCRRRARRFARTVRAADLVIAGNGFLGNLAAQAGASPERIRVIPTCIETRDYVQQASHSPQPEREGSKLDLVWIGSSSTLQGLEQKKTLWERLGREVPGVRLRILCDRFPQFQEIPVLEIPWSSESEKQELASADVGISWVPDDLWSRGKCGLKTLQYQAAGLPVLANPVGVHSEMIVPGENGFLPRTDQEWIDAVRQLASHPNQRGGMGRNARESVETHYSVQAWSSAFVAAISNRPEAATGPARRLTSAKSGRVSQPYLPSP